VKPFNILEFAVGSSAWFTTRLLISHRVLDANPRGIPTGLRYSLNGMKVCGGATSEAMGAGLLDSAVGVRSTREDLAVRLPNPVLLAERSNMRRALVITMFAGLSSLDITILGSLLCERYDRGRLAMSIFFDVRGTAFD
jgi:hypothetical protein